MSNLPAQSPPVYATDEDILVRASGDFMTLAPSWQCMAKGTDGFFATGVALGPDFCLGQFRHQRRHAEPGRLPVRPEVPVSRRR